MECLKEFDTITIVEPHHDDFCLDMFGTMLSLKIAGTLKKLKIIDVFSRGAGISQMPTIMFKTFFDDIDFDVIELGMAMIMRDGLIKGKNAEARALKSVFVGSFSDKFRDENGIEAEDLKDKIDAHAEGIVLGPMGFKHPDHNLISRLCIAELFYREYPYYWNRNESFEARLYDYNVYKLKERFVLDPELCAYKWSVFARMYKDVLGTFNPRFSRPYFRNVCSEELYEPIPGMVSKDVKECIQSDRDWMREKNSTHVIL